MLELWSHPETWISLLTLTGLEIVLGIDNIVFISILVSKLPDNRQQSIARRLGLAFALITRIGLLFSISWVMSLTAGLFTVMNQEISGRDIITLVGGLFLVGKATVEIFENLEVEGHEEPVGGTATRGMALMILQIMLLDIVFSLDSVITAVGMANQLSIMVVAVVVAVGVMLIFANVIGEFVESHPSIKVLALAFLILVGVMLIAESFDQHIPKGYIYFSMAFSLGVEFINIRVRKKRLKPVKLHSPSPPAVEPTS